MQDEDAVPAAPEVQRAFDVIERLAAADGYPLGRALVAEFVEVLFDEPLAVARMGPATRQCLG